MGSVAEFLAQKPVRCMLFLGTNSVLYALFNRIMMTKFFFDYPIMLLIIQMALLLFFIEVGRLCGLLKLHAYTFQRGRALFSASLFYIMAHFLTLNCLDGTSMPLFPFLQRFAPLWILEIGKFSGRKSNTSRADLVAISTICIASAAASVYEWSFDLWSLIYGVLALALDSWAMFQFERLREQYSSWLEMLYLHAFNCLCLLLLADLIQDEIRDSFMYLVTSTTALFVLILVLMIGVGLLFHLSLFLCIHHAGAVHSSLMNILAGGIQQFVAYGLSVYLFYDLAPTWTNVFGVIIASCAGIHYYIVRRALEQQSNGLVPVPSGGHKTGPIF